MRHVTRVLVSAVVIAGFGLLTAAQAAATPAPAATPAAAPTAAKASFGWAFADQPTNPSYVANPRMSFNSTGGTNTVIRYNAGNYDVRMPGLGGTPTDRGNVQVTAYGNHDARCKVAFWLPDSAGALVAGVLCETAAGQAADVPFVVQFWRAGTDTTEQSAYLQAEQKSTPSYVPDPRYSYNSRGGVNRINRLGTGIYNVQFGGFTTLGGIVHVTALGFSANYCKVRSWNTASAEVRCFTPDGQLADNAFSLRYQHKHLPNGFADLGGYAWANQASAAIGVPYVPNALHSYNAQHETNTVTRTAVGRYSVRFTRIPAFDTGSPMVTGHNADGVTCKVTALLSSGSSSRVDVDCRNAAGQFVDSMFTVSQTTNL